MLRDFSNWVFDSLGVLHDYFVQKVVHARRVEPHHVDAELCKTWLP